MRKILIVIGLLVTATAYAQQDPIYSMYLHNQLLQNPAYAGTGDRLNATALYRHQWETIASGPRTFTASVHGKVGEHNGLGLVLFNDVVGPVKFTGIYGSYAFRAKLGTGDISLGVQGGFRNFDDSEADWGPIDPVGQKVINSFLPNVGAGFQYVGQKFAFGVSAPELVTNTYEERVDVGGSELTSNQRNHYFVSAAYLMTFSESLKFKPSVLGKYVGDAPMNADLTGNLIIKDKYWLGATYRTDNSFAFMGLVTIDQSIGMKDWRYKIGYSYDISNKYINGSVGGSHELLLSFDVRKKSEQVMHLRWF